MKVKNIHLLLLLASLWGPSFLFIKIALEEIPPVMLAALRIGIAAVFLNVMLMMKGVSLPKDRTFWKRTFIAGLFAQAIPFVLISWGEQYVDSALASILNGLMPLFTIIFAHFMVAEERLSVNKAMGVMAGFIGLMVLISPNFDAGSQGTISGIGAIVLATVSYGIGLSYIKKHFSTTRSFIAPASQLLSVSIYLLPLAWVMVPGFNPLEVSTPVMLSLVSLAVFGTAWAFIVYFKLIEKAGATYASLVTYLMPIYGIILGVIFLNESLSMWMILGAALILIGIRLTKQKAFKRRSRFSFRVDTALYTKFR